MKNVPGHLKWHQLLLGGQLKGALISTDYNGA